ncbi:MAG: outer membrane lipoprotein-sorting protein [Mariprofundales bacterium]|nr:outer membrane lipoprotein-sorting protein [Mariprofundales bacterium]
MARQLLLAVLLLACGVADAATDAPLSGHDIIAASITRNSHYPFVFEVQSMILVDEDGHRDTRQLNRYSRVERDGTIKLLLRFTDPAPIRDTAMLSIISPRGVVNSSIFMPALADKMVNYRSSDRNGTFLGSDFSVIDLLPDRMDEYYYQRQADLIKGDDRWFVVEALPRSPDIEQSTGYSKRIMFVRMESMLIDRVDFFSNGMMIKQMSLHDIKRISGTSWVANMVLMHSFTKRHSSMLKVHNRIFGKDFVPQSLFVPRNITGYGAR